MHLQKDLNDPCHILLIYRVLSKLIMKMNSDDEDDILKPERLPIYQKGKEIFDMVNKIAALIPENNEYLMDVKGRCYVMQHFCL